MANNQSPAEWPLKARAIAEATDRGIRAARAHDLDGFGEALEQLEIHPEARDVHAHMVRELLETQYQDGVSGEDVSEVLTRAVDDAGDWNAPVDPSAMVVVLTGSLGVVESSDDDGPPTDIPVAQLTGAAIVVIADLAAGAALDHQPYLVRAVEEIRRAQTVEMP
ncbi:hypothetical protein [Gordonia rhizosphera]|uniref:Uncharacterized protein n=1 Tax=Gordonia rhizosphera NBRC 16068 TaxID=1108045 RepID=K6WF64_9ACTN|nr:hypothetical protein [Gordonia rhizosphera]GAB92386.1 hypothetical protein GORHZ_172_00040 [Gordonia rhizosphera NBRC 16068]